ncbi:MAG TPA: carboxypeptidase-like regulatory domain-containing protein, partial [Membranihabitans sp.]|nr:carboxypeptidase-like regulatory domain-containing protein [Membranihabitans sp.]
MEGQVSDLQGEPLIGVNVLVKGTNKGTSTDFAGKFVLEDVDDDAILIFSYIGYQTLEVAVEGQTALEIRMSSDAQLLDELVVVG